MPESEVKFFKPDIKGGIACQILADLVVLKKQKLIIARTLFGKDITD